jgi:hypothetical protein
MHLSSCPFPPVRPLAFRCGSSVAGIRAHTTARLTLPATSGVPERGIVPVHGAWGFMDERSHCTGLGSVWVGQDRTQFGRLESSAGLRGDAAPGLCFTNPPLAARFPQVRGADGQKGTPHVAPATTVRDMIDLNRITGVARQ